MSARISDVITDALALLENSWWIAWIVLIAGAVTFIVTFWQGIDWLKAKILGLMRGKPNWDDDRLKDEVKELIRDVSDFSTDRGYYIPDTWQLSKIDDEEEKNRKRYEMSMISIHHLTETMNLYTSKYLARIVKVRDEFGRRGITNKEFEQMYKNPTNLLGIKSLMVSLAEMLATLI